VEEQTRMSLQQVPTSFDTLFTRRYGQGERAQVDALYTKGRPAWDVDLDIDWSIGWADSSGPVIPQNPLNRLVLPTRAVSRKLSSEQRAELGHAARHGRSAFLHTEQAGWRVREVGAVRAVGRRQVLRLGTQVMDEARHMEVYGPVLRRNSSGSSPSTPPWPGLLEDVVRDSRWIFTYLGMQVVIGGLALVRPSACRPALPGPAAQPDHPLRAADEARHVAFGVLSPARGVRGD